MALLTQLTPQEQDWLVQNTRKQIAQEAAKEIQKAARAKEVAQYKEWMSRVRRRKAALQAGRKQMTEEQYEEAVKEYDAAMEKDPCPSPCHNFTEEELAGA